MVERINYRDEVLEAVDNGFMNAKQTCMDLLVWMSEYQVQQFCEAYDLFQDEEDDDDEEAEA